MFQFPWFASTPYVFRCRYPCGWVAPFGHPGIKAFWQLPQAFRSLTRPSSPLCAKASTKCPSHTSSTSPHTAVKNRYTWPNRSKTQPTQNFSKYPPIIRTNPITREHSHPGHNPRRTRPAQLQAIHALSARFAKHLFTMTNNKPDKVRYLFSSWIWNTLSRRARSPIAWLSPQQRRRASRLPSLRDD